jgi:hypothetical protein
MFISKDLSFVAKLTKVASYSLPVTLRYGTVRYRCNVSYHTAPYGRTVPYRMVPYRYLYIRYCLKDRIMVFAKAIEVCSSHVLYSPCSNTNTLRTTGTVPTRFRTLESS